MIKFGITMSIIAERIPLRKISTPLYSYDSHIPASYLSFRHYNEIFTAFLNLFSECISNQQEKTNYWFINHTTKQYGCTMIFDPFITFIGKVTSKTPI